MPSLDDDELALTALTAVTQVRPNTSADDLIHGHLQLIVISNGTFSTFGLPDEGPQTLGRGSGCDIAVKDDSISRRHAILQLGETVTIEDLGSVNGTVVRGSKIEPKRPTPINVGELVGVGTASIILQRRSRPLRARTLWTHEQFAARLAEECAREARTGTEFVLMRLHFKSGTPEAFIEETLSELLRDSDIVGKHDAHEYEVLLPDTPAPKADDAVQRIENKLLERGLKCRVYFACCPRDGRNAAELDAKARRRSSTEKRSVGTDIVVSDPQMQALYKLVEQIAVSDISVLLLGETGVGKEVFARAVHRASPRASGPFIELNCAALTEPLLESELFGHEKGAFTNAVSAKPGLLEMADGGTMFLDEIGDMPLTTQVKLLRVIEDSKLRRVGGLKPRPIDVRFVAATNSDIESQVARGAFRSDLFFRLNGVTIVIPPLRERLDELEALTKAFISRARRGGTRPTLTAEAVELLRGHAWPGNVRELKNVIERAVLLCGDGPIEPAHLSLAVDRSRRGVMGSEGMAAIVETSSGKGDATPPVGLRARPPKGSEEEQQWIMRALEQTRGNQTRAARLLGISRRTLINRLNEYGRPRKS